MGATTTFDLDGFRRAAEERDDSLAMFEAEAVVTIADKLTVVHARTRAEP